jgi:hypothetical protein
MDETVSSSASLPALILIPAMQQEENRRQNVSAS